MLSSKSTKRNFGSCPRCGHSYFPRRKPPNCEECGYDLGGTNQLAPKRNCPSAVLFVGSSHFSCKTSRKDDRRLQGICSQRNVWTDENNLCSSPRGALTVEEPPSTGDSDHPVAAAERTTSTSTAYTQRLSTLELNANRQLAYDFISPDLLRAIDEQNARSWPKKFAPTATGCKLCGHNLGEEVKHPGSKGQAYLLTMARPFAKVDVRVLICKNSACRAINQADPANIGKSVLLSMLVYYNYRIFGS